MHNHTARLLQGPTCQGLCKIVFVSYIDNAQIITVIFLASKLYELLLVGSSVNKLITVLRGLLVLDRLGMDIGHISILLLVELGLHGLLGVRLEALISHLGDIKAMGSDVLEEVSVLVLDRGLGHRRQEEVGDESREDTEGGGDPERTLDSGNLRVVLLKALDNQREALGTDESSNLTHGGGDTVEDTSDSSGGVLGGQQTNVSSRSHLSKSLEDTVSNDETGGVLDHGLVDSSHDETDNSLENQRGSQSDSRSEPVGKDGSKEGSGEVKGGEQNTPAKGLDQAIFGVERVDNHGGVDSKGERNEVVEHPHETDDQQSGSVVPQSQQVGRSGSLEVVLSEGLGLLELGSEVEQRQRRNGSQSDSQTPDPGESVLSKDPQEDQRHKRGDNEAEINHETGEENKPSVSGSRSHHSRGLRAGHRSSGVLSSNTDSDEKSVGNQGRQHTIHVGASSSSPGSSTQDGEDDQDKGRDNHTHFSGMVVGDKTKDKHTQHGSSKDNGRDGSRVSGVLVLFSVQDSQTGVNGSHGVVNVSIREETSSSSNNGPSSAVLAKQRPLVDRILGVNGFLTKLLLGLGSTGESHLARVDLGEEDLRHGWMVFYAGRPAGLYTACTCYGMKGRCMGRLLEFRKVGFPTSGVPVLGSAARCDDASYDSVRFG